MLIQLNNKHFANIVTRHVNYVFWKSSVFKTLGDIFVLSWTIKSQKHPDAVCQHALVLKGV